MSRTVRERVRERLDLKDDQSIYGMLFGAVVADTMIWGWRTVVVLVVADWMGWPC